MTRLAGLLALFLATAIASGATPDDISVTIGPIQRPPGGLVSAPFDVVVKNETNTPIPQTVELVLRLHGDATITAFGNEFMNCLPQTSSNEVRCRTGTTLNPMGGYVATVTISPLVERRLLLVAYATWTVGGEQLLSGPRAAQIVFPRGIDVTNNGDEGPGSLRAAIEYANANCAGIPCEILFRLSMFSGPSEPPGAWAVFTPNTPLPEITAPDLIIDGASQPGFGGENDPKLSLNGAALWYGSGLVVTGSGLVTIRNLNVFSFPWDGIALLRRGEDPLWRSSISENNVGHNGSRGINVQAPSARFDIRNNLILLNRRSGVFIEGGRDLYLDRNEITDNAASGLYISATTEQVDVFRNDIHDNLHWGIAIGRGARLVELFENTFFRNANAPIEVGIDGFDGFGYDPEHDRIGAPLLISAVLDASGVTTITGTHSAGSSDITLYTSSTAGQAERVLGHVPATGGTFTVTVRGLSPGAFITATAFHLLGMPPREWSTELSNAVRVE
jgi:hypothetical protein